MTRASLLAAIAAAALVVFVPLAGATSSSGLSLTEVNGTTFPTQTFVLSLPVGVALRPDDVTVTENGAAIPGVSLEAARKASKHTFGTVLVLDTSLTMHGAPLIAARNAELTFADQRNPNEELGAIDFNADATTILPLTTSRAKIDTALGAPRHLARGTHILDAVARAESMLRAAHISSGSIIVLSDGADTGSRTSLEDVARAALAANARIYTVGLRDSSYSPETLTVLAAAGRGEYVEETAQGLAPLFAHIGRVLSSQYLVSYTTPFVNPGGTVRVEVDVRGVGTATTVYRTPQSSSGTESGNSSVGTKIVKSPVTMIALALVFAIALAFVLVGVLEPRRTRLPGRIAEFVSIRELQRGYTAAAPLAIGEPTEQKDAHTRLAETLEIARIGVEPEVLIVMTIVATVLVFVFIFAVTGSVIWALFALLVPYFSREWVLRALKRQRYRFAEQLPEALQVIASALRSGHSFAGSLAVVVESASDPMRTELQRVVADEQLGMPIQRSLSVVADRMASSDVDQLALVAELQRQTGGATAEVIDRVAETVRERFDLRRLVQTLTTQGRMSRWIVSLLPVVIVVAISIENPHYFHPLIASTIGKVFVFLAVLWAVIGSFVIKNIVEIEV